MELSTSTSKSSQLSIPLTLRIGITGSRSLEAVQLQRVRSEAASFLKAVRRIALDLTSSPTVRPLYAIGDTSNSSAQLWLLSALAEGSDRVVAEVALNEGFSLHSPLPFSREEYENDFHSDESRQEFRDLLRRAEPYILELDGARGNAQGSSYRAAGRFIVRNCDLLIAVWDGRLAKGPGGTGEIVEFAVERGLPVWWINVDEDATPTWVVGWNDSPLVADTSEHSTPLRTYLTELISPPKEVEAAPHTLFERVAKWGKNLGPRSMPR
jgi:hypothetical protein